MYVSDCTPKKETQIKKTTSVLFVQPNKWQIQFEMDKTFTLYYYSKAPWGK